MKKEREVSRSSKGCRARSAGDLREYERSARNRGGGTWDNDDQGPRNVTGRMRTNLNTREEHCAPLRELVED